MVKTRNGNPVNRFGTRKGWFKESHRHKLASQGIKTAKTTTERRMDFIKGGLADNIPASAFDQEQLKKGMKVEMEHTSDPKIAQEISKDHLSENPNYYIELEKMEKKMEKKSDWKKENLGRHGTVRFYHTKETFNFFVINKDLSVPNIKYWVHGSKIEAKGFKTKAEALKYAEDYIKKH